MTGRKADLVQHPSATGSATRESRWLKRPRIISESESDLSSRRSAFLISSAELGKDSKRARLSHSPRRREFSQDTEVHGSSQAHHPHRLRRILRSSPEPSQSNTDLTIISDDSDTSEKQRRKNTATHRKHALNNTNIGPDPTTQKQDARIKDEPLTLDIISRIKLRVKADGPGVKARGPILVDFEVYKTSERLFTSLMSERSLKPEMQMKVSQLTATVNGKETCCRRNRLDDWTEVCRELRKLWDNSPKLFIDRFEVDVMLHVDE